MTGWNSEMELESAREQRAVLAEAAATFVERNRKYKDLWKQYEPEDHALHIKSKAMRVVQSINTGEEPEVVIEDAIDLINYAAFLIRSLRGDRS